MAVTNEQWGYTHLETVPCRVARTDHDLCRRTCCVWYQANENGPISFLCATCFLAGRWYWYQ